MPSRKPEAILTATLTSGTDFGLNLYISPGLSFVLGFFRCLEANDRSPCVLRHKTSIDWTEALTLICFDIAKTTEIATIVLSGILKHQASQESPK